MRLQCLPAARRGGLIHALMCTSENIVGPAAKGAVDIDAPVKDNLRAIAKRMNRDVDDAVDKLCWNLLAVYQIGC